MNGFLRMLRDKFGGKYDYLRVKSAEVFKQSKKVNLTLYIPEDIFDYELENEDIVNIKTALSAEVNGSESVEGGYIFNLFFEKIYHDEELVRSAIIDYIKSNYPYIGANVDFENMRLRYGDTIFIELVIQNSVYDYAKKSELESSLIQYLTDKFFLQCELNYEIVEDLATPPIEENIPAVRSVFVPISETKWLCGVDNLKGAAPKHIAAISEPGDKITVCGKIESIECKIWDEKRAVEGKRFYKYHYILTLNDTSGTIRVLFNTNDEQCALNSTTFGDELVVRGRAFYKEESGKYIIFAKGIGNCTIDFETVKAQLAPLSPPAEYKINPYKYTGASTQIKLDIFEETEKRIFHDEAVALHYLSYPKVNDEIIYEIACVGIREGELAEVYHTFLKSPTSGGMSLEAKARTITAPRIASVIPDLIKFTEGKVIVAIDVFGKLRRLNEIAMPLKYVFHNELKEITTLGKKKNKTGGFLALAKNAGINILSDASALEYAEAIAKLYLKIA